LQVIGKLEEDMPMEAKVVEGAPEYCKIDGCKWQITPVMSSSSLLLSSLELSDT
jgi:hypothetical protein